MELRARRELERERVAAQLRRMRLAQQRRGRDPAALLDGREDGARPGLLQLRELERRGADRHGNRRGAGSGSGTAAARRLLGLGRWRPARCRRGPAPARAARGGTRSTRARGRWPGRVTLTSASSSGRRGSPPWRMSSTATASRSISRRTVGLPELVRLRLQPLARLLARRGASGTSPQMLREHELPQVLDQVEDEPAEVVARAPRAPPDT